MKVCVIGAGAIGGWTGARLSASTKSEVSAVARGATLDALRTHGWRLHTATGLISARPHALAGPDDTAGLGEQDLVILAVKATALAAATRCLPPLLGPDTIVLPLMNGVPWWFAQHTDLGAEPLRSVDPDGAIAAAIDVDRVLGGVVYGTCAVREPGVVQHVRGDRVVVGEPFGGVSPRAETVGALLSTAGFDVTVAPDVRHEIWYKLWGNMTINPIAALTGATADRILDDPLVRDFCSAAMHEAAAIGRLLGCAIGQTPEDRHQETAKLGAFKPSMLQDAEAGRPVELDALVAVVRELGARSNTPTPYIDALLGLSRLAGRTRGLY